MVQRSGLGYGTCSHCGRQIGISERGLIRNHGLCPGRGRYPAEQGGGRPPAPKKAVRKPWIPPEIPRCYSCDHIGTLHNKDGCFWYFAEVRVTTGDDICPCSLPREMIIADEEETSDATRT